MPRPDPAGTPRAVHSPHPDPATARAPTRQPQTTHLGRWQLRCTLAVRRARRARLQLLLLYPPPGFSGSARLGVISGGRREEYSGHWREGYPRDLAPAAARALAPLVAALAFPGAAPEAVSAPAPGTAAPAGFPPAAIPPVSWPVVAGARWPAGPRAANLSVDLLLEVSEDGQTTASSGHMTVSPPAEESLLQVIPILLPPHQSRAAETERETRALARSARWHRGLRAGVLLGEQAQPRVWQPLYELLAEGRTEAIASPTGPALPPSLPFPGRTAWVAAEHLGAALAGGLPGIHGLLVAAAPGAGALLPGLALIKRPDPDAAPLPALRMAPWAASSPCPTGLEACWLALADRLLRDAPRARIEGSRGHQQIQAWACWPRVCTRASEVAGLARWAGRWNRRHATPRLRLATPSDCFALIEELMARGILSAGR